MTNDMIGKLLEQLIQILCLDSNWDGYGALPLQRNVADTLLADLVIIFADYKNIPEPYIVPGGDGSIQAEWNLTRVSTCYHIDTDLSVYFDMEIYGNDSLIIEHIESFGPESRDRFKEYAHIVADA